MNIAIAAAAAGETPLEYMLRVMRDETVEPLVRLDMAKAAAPYCHARLAATEISGPDGKELTPIINVNIMRFSDPVTGEISAGPPKLING